MSNVTRFRGAAAVVMATALTLATVASPRDAFGQAATQPTTRPAAAATVPTTQPSVMKVASNDTIPVVARTSYDQTPHQRIAGNNYEIVRMHAPKSERDAAMGPSLEVLNANGRLVIVNYSRPGSPGSDKQRQWIESALEAAAKRSRAGILYLDVQAMRVNEQNNTVDIAYMPSLMAALQNNRLGKDGATVPFDPKTDRPLFPYAEIAAGNQYISSFSYSLYPQTGTDEQRRDAILSEVLNAIDRSNAIYTAKLTQGKSTVGTMAAMTRTPE